MLLLSLVDQKRPHLLEALWRPQIRLISWNDSEWVSFIQIQIRRIQMLLTDATATLPRSRNSSTQQYLRCAGMHQHPLKQAEESLGIRSAGHNVTERTRSFGVRRRVHVLCQLLTSCVTKLLNFSGPHFS